jgi:multicomponent Na+:H+ antiporter subunit B
MSRAARLVVAAAAALALAPGAAGVIRHLPPFGAHPLPYGDAINRAGVTERHVTNMVTAVNFDYRGIDTLGEEFILLAAVTGTLVLLRGRRGESVSDEPARVPGRLIPPRSDGVTLVCRLFAPALIAFGLYVMLHAQLTPGGGFQGGVIIASGTVLVYLGDGYRTWKRLMEPHLFDAIEAGGALVFALVGFWPMFAGAYFLQNILPLGRTRSLLSGGVILIENAGVAFAVAAAFILLSLEFLEETRATRRGDS